MSFNLQPTYLENELIQLLPLKASDFEALFEIASDPLLWEQHPNKDRYKKEVFEVVFKGAIESKGAFIVIDKKNKLPIGTSRYYDFNEQDKSIAIGYTFISRSHWGKGYNSFLKDLMLNYAFTYFNTVFLHVGATNYRSQKAVEKLGAIKIKEFEMAYVGEANRSNFLYEIKKENWEKRKK